MKPEFNKSGETPLHRNEVTVGPIDLHRSKKMIEENHYLGKWSPSSVCLGVFKVGISEPVGTLVYGPICGRPVLRGLFTKSEIPLRHGNVFRPSNSSVLELKRMWVEDGHGFNIESLSISKSFDWLRENHPEVRVLVSYSDPSVGHRGTIYQSTNWWYQKLYETEDKTDFYVTFKHPSRTKPGEWNHSRTLGHIYGRRSLDILKRKIGRTFWIRPNIHKYRYLYFLGGKSERKRLMEFLSHPITRDYPKETKENNDTRKITVLSE